MYTTIKLSNIHVDDDVNYRTKLDPASLKELHQSYVSIHKRTKGKRWMLNPVDVIALETPIDGKEYQLRFGFRRFHAAALTVKRGKKYAWARDIPAVVMPAEDVKDPSSWLLMALTENLQREDTSPLDEARACQKALDATGMTLSALGKELGKSKGWISQRMTLLKLAPTVQAALAESEITFGHARELCRLDNADQQEKMLGVVGMNGWDVRETKHHVQGLKDGDPTPQTQFIYDGHEVPKPKGAPKKKAEEKTSARKPKALMTTMSTLSERAAGVHEKRKAAPAGARSTYDRETSFYAGAKAAFEYALGRSEGVDFNNKEKEDA